MLCKHPVRGKCSRCVLPVQLRCLGGIPCCDSGFGAATGYRGLNGALEIIVQAFRDGRNAIGRRGLVLSGIPEFLQDISSSRCIFICIEALDEWPPGGRAEPLDSPNKILQKSPGARIFLTKGQHIRGEIDRYLTRRAATRSDPNQG